MASPFPTPPFLDRALREIEAWANHDIVIGPVCLLMNLEAGRRVAMPPDSSNVKALRGGPRSERSAPQRAQENVMACRPWRRAIT